MAPRSSVNTASKLKIFGLPMWPKLSKLLKRTIYVMFHWRPVVGIFFTASTPGLSPSPPSSRRKKYVVGISVIHITDGYVNFVVSLPWMQLSIHSESFRTARKLNTARCDSIYNSSILFVDTIVDSSVVSRKKVASCRAKAERTHHIWSMPTHEVLPTSNISVHISTIEPQSSL